MKASHLIRLCVALSLLCGAAFLVGIDELAGVYARLRMDYFCLLILLSVVMIWASCVKWRLFINAAGHDASILRLMQLYVVGYFYNSFLPSYFGGDIARSLHLGADISSMKSGFATTILERFTGLLAMTLLGALFVVVGTKATEGVEFAILIVAAGALVAALILFSEAVSSKAFSLLRKIARIAPHSIEQKCDWFLEKLDQAMAFARADSRLFAKAMLWSLVFHLLTVVNTYIAALAVGWQSPDITGLFVVVPLVLLISMIPITPSGLGLQEGAFLFFLSRIGASNGEALGVGLVLRAKVLIIAAVGGLLWANLKRPRARAKSV